VQQHHGHRGDDLVVHADFAPRQHGLQVFQKIMAIDIQSKMSGIQTKIESKIPAFLQFGTTSKIQTIVMDNTCDPKAKGGKKKCLADVPDMDEFADATDSDDYEENLDPLFGLDLDKMTEGPGLLMLLARGAIYLHRINLAIFYYFPRRIAMAMLGMLQPLLHTPPIMAIVAVTVRQLIGKIVLGAKLPSKVTDEKKKSDIMSMIKNMVKSFILSSFPTMVSMYDMWVHLRADMYIVLCGLFVGVVWNHFVMSENSRDVKDEL
jgi:hypothetical protein